MKELEIKKIGEFYVYSAFIDGVFKITTSEKKLSIEELVNILRSY